VFGLSLAEIVLLVVVGIVVVGPRNVPPLMRQAGRFIAKIRRMSVDLRSQSGLDDLIRQEGLEREIAERRTLSRVNVIDTVIAPMVSAAAAAEPPPARREPSSTRPEGAVARAPSWEAPEPTATAAPFGGSAYADPDDDADLRFAREVPELGCDAYGALPDEADPYRDLDDAPPPSRELPEAGCDAYGAVEEVAA
jgi:sec-independent protein translocase protein TatB